MKELNFSKLKKLYLSSCFITDISFLENTSFKYLEILDLSDNYQISNIFVLENIVLKELKELYLKNCNISDISFLKNVKFEKLEKLNLGCNSIVNYELLEELQFNNLNECKISNIEFLKRVGYEVSFPLGYERQWKIE